MVVVNGEGESVLDVDLDFDSHEVSPLVGKIVASTGCRKRWVSLRSTQPTAEVYRNGAFDNHTIGVNLGKISIFPMM